MGHGEWIAAINKRLGELADGTPGDIVSLITRTVQRAAPCEVSIDEARKITGEALETYHRLLVSIGFVVMDDPDAGKKSAANFAEAERRSEVRRAERKRRG